MTEDLSFTNEFPVFLAIDQVVEELTTGPDPWPMWIVIDALREVAEICEECGA